MERWKAFRGSLVVRCPSVISSCSASLGLQLSSWDLIALSAMKRSTPEPKTPKRPFEDAPLCPACGGVPANRPEARFAARINTKQAYWPHAHPHDIARTVRLEVSQADIEKVLRQKNLKEIGAEVFPAPPLPSPHVDDRLFALRYTLDPDELHNRHPGDLIEVLEKEIEGASDKDARRTELEHRLQQTAKANSERRRACRDQKGQ